MATVTLFFCCLLGSISLVHGQTLVRLAAANEFSTLIDHTGDIVSFTVIGPGYGRCPWICFTTDPTNVEWQFPNGTTVTEIENKLDIETDLSSGRTIRNRYALFRGHDYFPPDGEYCCVRMNGSVEAERKCVTFTPCPTLSPVMDTNGTISYNPITNEATYSCVTGYTPTSETALQITCESNGTSAGTWFPTPPLNVTCTIVDCGELGDPTNGAVNTSSGTTYLQTATYSCVAGYRLIGDVTRTCQLANGMWSSSEPACEFIVLSIGGTVYTNSTTLSLSLIGEGFSALTCHTELITCCREQDNPTGGALGGWRGPDGNSILEASNTCPSDGFYMTRGVRTISLNHHGSETLAGGVYCCTIPRASGAIQTLCVLVQVPAPLTIDGPTVALGVLLAIAVVAIVVLITLVIIGKKQLSQARSQLKQIFQNKQQLAYDSPDQVVSYENIRKLDVGGPPTAIKLSECPAYGPTGSGSGQRRDEDHIYDN